MSDGFDWELPKGWEFPGGEVNIPHTLKEIQEGQWLKKPLRFTKDQVEDTVIDDLSSADWRDDFVWLGGYPLTPEQEAERKKRNDELLAPSRRRYRLSLTGSRICKAQRKARRA